MELHNNYALIALARQNLDLSNKHSSASSLSIVEVLPLIPVCVQYEFTMEEWTLNKSENPNYMPCMHE